MKKKLLLISVICIAVLDCIYIYSQDVSGHDMKIHNYVQSDTVTINCFRCTITEIQSINAKVIITGDDNVLTEIHGKTGVVIKGHNNTLKHVDRYPDGVLP